ncbi:(2Fe-2S)-binding protein [Mycobacterium sp. 852013-50091_SCH5140682]|nr:(2Fe-2S)-binding protein [Mycobacterium sp. 852013-50091_SCH5140682]
MVLEDRVDRLAYTDADVFAAEMRNIFGRVWVYVGHASEIPLPHDFVTRTVGGRPLILTRDSAGEPHVLVNRCRHRGATVCRVDSGRTKRFTCPYHGWAYASNGDLTGVPWPAGYGEDFAAADFPLQRAKVDTYRGFIFASLNHGVQALSDYLGPAAELIDAWINRFPGGRLVARHGANRLTARANWKLALDNSADGYHPAFSHRSLLQMASRHGDGKDMGYFAESPDEGPLYAQYLGNGHIFVDQRPAYSGTGSLWERQRPAPGRETYEALIRAEGSEDAEARLDLTVGAQMNLTIFPNLLFIGSQIQVLEPIAVDRTELRWYATSSAEVSDALTTMRMRHQEDFLSFGEPDDLANFNECQRGLSVPEVRWVMINRGFGVPDRQQHDERGVVTGPVTDELPARGYWNYWATLMSSDVESGGVVQ